MSENTSKNQSHWDQNASTYNSKFAKTIQQIQAEIVARKDWIGVDWIEDASSDENEASNSSPKKTVKLLDYACGTGLVSRALAPYLSQTIGVDLSSGMVNEYNTTCLNQGIPTSEMQAYVGNLLDPSDPYPAAFQGKEFWDFDLAIVGLGFHHFDNPALATKRLSERLKKGGVLMIVDFLPHEGVSGQGHGHGHGHGNSNSNAAHTVMHNGFSEADAKSMFEAAGLGEFSYVKVGKGIVFGEGNEKLDRSVFMARGAKL